MPADAPADRSRRDACPGAVTVHGAADGGLARIRVPGGTMTAPQFHAVFAASAALGDGQLELTSRANIQIRGLRPGAEAKLAERLREAGLLPSLSHERVRNIIASPLGADQPLVDELDRELCSWPELADLPGRFLITVDSQGDVSGLGGDVGLARVGPDWALLLASQDTGVRVPENQTVTTVIAAAQAFLVERRRQGSAAWRLHELTEGPQRVLQRLALPVTRRRLMVRPAVPLRTGFATPRTLVVGAPLGRLDAAQSRELLRAAGPTLRLTPWRSIVLRGVEPSTVVGRDLIIDPNSPWHGVTSCAGMPGCVKAVADVRADAAAWLRERPEPSAQRVHWSGCSRRCGRPQGQVIDVVATDEGYEVNEKLAPDTAAALAAARRNT
ncbi:hypothetical protein NLX83_24995 [Allokutzneria sp. A3M-2-11 16]|uniref:hypothetical protein n=1 Tax=Allokutzneria sp. A3M-2-11 16 TaxID=2962043 RepID=UPI0020B8C05C|nr:hypothetical protein [Allokutzneria sp. A3M-2-11 16]MCP3802533.1 hypothetical protein [Allokutzneria sp. A3M-2-11 16]